MHQQLNAILTANMTCVRENQVKTRLPTHIVLDVKLMNLPHF